MNDEALALILINDYWEERADKGEDEFIDRQYNYYLGEIHEQTPSHLHPTRSA